MQQLQDLAQKLGQCSKCMKQGKADEAVEQLAQMREEMKKLQRQLDEMEMLDDAMQQLAQAREQMGCQECGEGECDQAGRGKEDEDDGPDRPGGGIGRERGRHPRVGKKIDARYYDSQVKQKVGPGAASVVDLVDGPNVKGNVQQQIQQQVDSARNGATDPLTGRRMPRKHGKHAKEYFDRLRGE